jgi:hypothetical protein
VKSWLNGERSGTELPSRPAFADEAAKIIFRRICARNCDAGQWPRPAHFIDAPRQIRDIPPMRLRWPAHIRPPHRFWPAAAIVWVITSAATLPMCGAMFSCGCSLLTAAKYCNIHQPGVPHCPWCVSHVWAVVSFAAMLIAGGLGVLGGLTRSGVEGWQRMLTGISLALAAALILGSLAGLILAVSFGYPTWWGLRVFNHGIHAH